MILFQCVDPPPPPHILHPIHIHTHTHPAEVPRPVDPAIIIGPIAAFAIILLAVLILLLVIAFL